MCMRLSRGDGAAAVVDLGTSGGGGGAGAREREAKVHRAALRRREDECGMSDSDSFPACAISKEYLHIIRSMAGCPLF